MLEKKIIICPNEEKIRLLKKDTLIQNRKFMTIQEFINNFYFSYDERTLYYCIEKYHYDIDVLKVYLNNLYGIDSNKEYKNKKLKFLQSLKKELVDNNLLTYNEVFHDYLKTNEIEIIQYMELEKYLLKDLNKTIIIPNTTLDKEVYEYETIEDEINATCIEIRKLLEQGINPNKIFLTNINEEYLFLLKRLFNYYQIPINIDLKESIYSTKLVQDYLNGNELDLDNKEYSNITSKIISCLKKVAFLEEGNTKDIIKIDLLKNTYITPKKYKNAVNIVNFYNRSFEDDEYVFLLGMNQDILPNMEKDISYITDSLKDEIDMYKIEEINKRRKEVTRYLLSKIKNLTCSYKNKTPFTTYYPSSLITDLNLKVIKPNKDTYNYSSIYNQIRLGEKMDMYDRYGEKEEDLLYLLKNYDIPYKTYNNQFMGISLDTYQKNLPYPLNLSYTSLNSYNECKFKYYIRNVLKIEEYEKTFASFLGSLYHEILSLYRKENFDIDIEMNKYIETRECTLKEKILLNRIKKELKELIEIIKKQNLLTGYDEEYYEKKIEVKVKNDISVIFVGYIDKIMAYKKIEDTYFSIIDYKTGTIDTHIEPIKYGLHLQLPIYLYLIHYGRLFTNPIFTGIYYQNIMFPYPSWSKTVEEDKKKRYYLNGYSTNKIEVLERFDATYEDSEWIKSLKYKDNKFSLYTKIIDDDTLYNLVKFVKKHIEEKTEEIIKADFKINPKIYDKENISCSFCTFKDLCYVKEKDYIYLDKVEDLSFLGGEKE